MYCRESRRADEASRKVGSVRKRETSTILHEKLNDNSPPRPPPTPLLPSSPRGSRVPATIDKGRRPINLPNASRFRASSNFEHVANPPVKRPSSRTPRRPIDASPKKPYCQTEASEKLQRTSEREERERGVEGKSCVVRVRKDYVRTVEETHLREASDRSSQRLR